MKSYKIEIEADEDYSRLGNSRIGGLPDLPIDKEYPTDENGFYQFIAQINLVDLEVYNDLLPNAGLLQFFIGAVSKNQCQIIYYPEIPDDLLIKEPPRNLKYFGDADYHQAVSKKLLIKSVDGDVEFLSSVLIHPTGLCYKGSIYFKMLDLIELDSNVLFPVDLDSKVQYFGMRSGRINTIEPLLANEEECFLIGKTDWECWKEKLIEFDNNKTYHEDRYKDLMCLASFQSNSDIYMVWGDMMNLEFYMFKEDLKNRYFDKIVVEYAPS